MKSHHLSPHEELEQRLARPRKRRPKMRVHGKSVFTLQQLARRPQRKKKSPRSSPR